MNSIICDKKCKKYITKYKLYLYICIFNIFFLPKTFHFQSLKKEFNIFRKLNYDSEIEITIIGKGTQNILSYGFDINSNPFEISINNESFKEYSDNKVYNLTSEENIIRIKWKNQLISCENMFEELYNIKYINLKNFDSSQVKNMNLMFYRCSSLISLDLTNFDTSSVTSMFRMFQNCGLEWLNLSHINTSKVENMESMFEASGLVSLDLSNFNTLSVKNMNYMFAHCYSLISLNLSSFKTPSLNQNYRMFYFCSVLKALDMSNFDFTNANSVGEMFNHCSSLISLNLINFNIPSNIGINNIFGSNNKNLIYCVNNNSLYTQLVNNDILNNDCSNICFNYSSKIIIEKNKCIYNCNDDDEYIYEYNRRCYKLCPTGTHANLEFSNLCEKDSDENDENNDNIISIIENNTNISLSKNDSKDTDNITEKQKEELIDNLDIIISNINGTSNSDKFISNINETSNLDELIPNIYETSNLDELIQNINEIKYNVIKIEDNEDMYQLFFIDNQNNNISHSDIKINISIIVYKQFTEGNFDELISNIIEKEGKDIIILHKNTIIQFTTADNQKKKSK